MITIDQKIVEWVETNWTTADGWPWGNLLLCVIALVLCTLLVGVIGIEREIRGRSAGLRTHLLVGVSSTIIMIISIYGFPAVFQNHRDVARLAAQVVTGVGFLGAGAIIHRNSGIKGLTTAGTIWASMAIGIACGSFNFILAIVGTLLIFVVLTIFKKVEIRVSKKSPTIVLTAPLSENVEDKIAEINEIFHAKVEFSNMTIVEDSKPTYIELAFKVNFTDNENHLTEYTNEIKKRVSSCSLHLISHF